MIALRASAILLILIAALYVRGAIIAAQSGFAGDAIWLMLAGIVMPLVPGLFASFGRATVLLPVAWGWLLGVHLPKLLIVRPPIPPEAIQMVRRNGGRLYAFGPDYYAMGLVATALIGLGLYFYAYYKECVR